MTVTIPNATDPNPTTHATGPRRPAPCPSRQTFDTSAHPGRSTRHAPAIVAAAQLLRRSEEGLRLAEATADPGRRFCEAHLAAIRAAAAVLAVRGRPRRGSGALNVWEVLPRVAPELREWAVFYASGAPRRAAIEAGMAAVVTTRDADDLCRQTALFAELVAEELGLPSPTPGA